MENLNDLLKTEYIHLQNTIETFDSKALNIKSWSVTFSLAACGVAFTSNAPAIFLIATISSIVFWILEASWKTFQYAHYSKIIEIENYFKDPSLYIIPLQITKSWQICFNKEGTERFFTILFWYHVYLPHTLISIISFALLLMIHYDIITI